MVAAPNAVAVQDFARYVKLLAPPAENEEGEEEAQTVDPEETARAVAAAPADPAVRMTHALALVKAGRGEESFALFDDITIYFNRLPPPLQAVLAGAAAASGQRGLAAEMRGKIDVSKLTPDERRIFEESAGL
jgi:predicted Zn-dependent protease